MIIWRMPIACWITEATNPHREYAVLLFHSTGGYANALQCYDCTYVVGLVKHLTIFGHRVMLVCQLVWLMTVAHCVSVPVTANVRHVGWGEPCYLLLKNLHCTSILSVPLCA